MMNTGEALKKINDYLRDSGADEETFRAFNVIRNQYTRLIGQLMEMCVRTEPSFEDENKI